MKILILQLARLGDIYTTWPTIHALQRKFPDAEIHVVARKKFSSAFTGNLSLKKIIHLPTEDLFSPILTEHISDCANGKALDASVAVLEGFINEIVQENYDLMYNLTFSPFSSYLTHCLSRSIKEIKGYNRHQDGFLALNDDISAYFYAQVGVGKMNRFHLCDIFAEVCDVSLTEADWEISKRLQDLPDDYSYLSSQDYIVFHLGASTTNKTYASEKWSNALRLFLNKNKKHKVVLIGSPAEKQVADKVLLGIKPERIVNIVGKTSIPDLFPIIANANLLIGCDSAPIHIASLTKTACLNLSNSNVNYWETGPKAPNSRILFSSNFDMLTSDKVVKHIVEMLEASSDLIEDCVSVTSERQYKHKVSNKNDFCWNLIKAMYQGEDFPLSETFRFYEALQKISEVNDIALEQLANFRADATQAEILNRVDDILATIGKQVFEVKPIISWYETEKTRLGPEPQEVLVENYVRIHSDLKFVADVYLSAFDENGKEAINGTEDLG